MVFPDWVAAWLTPLWLVGVGAIGGLLLCCALWGVLFVLGAIGVPRLRKLASEMPLVVREGVLFPLLILTLVFAAFGAFGFKMVSEPGELVASLRRLPQISPRTVEAQVDPTPRDSKGEPDQSQEQAVPVEFDRDELEEMRISASENVLVYALPYDEQGSRPEYEVAAGEDFLWKRSEQPATTFAERQVERLYVVNRGGEPASLSIYLDLRPAHPEVRTVVVTALLIAACFLLYALQAGLFPRASAIALATFKSEISQPLFLILTVGGMALLTIFMVVPYNTFGEDIKVFKDTGLDLLLVLAVFQAVWAAGTSVSDEVEGRTALTVLSKPISRRSFLIGKFLGITWTVALMVLLITVVFLVLVCYKPIYDTRETSEDPATWQQTHREMASLVPGVALTLMETLVLASIAVAISTRLGLIPNLVICFSVYLLGNLTPMLVQQSVESRAFEVVVFFAQLIATITPNLETFNVSAAMAAGRTISLAYLGVAFVYCLVYSLIALFLALLLFEDRDLA